MDAEANEIRLEKERLQEMRCACLARPGLTPKPLSLNVLGWGSLLGEEPPWECREDQSIVAEDLMEKVEFE